MQTIQVKRGLRANLPLLQTGEMAYTTDTHQLFVGTGSANVEMASATIEQITLTPTANALVYNSTASRNGSQLILNLALGFTAKPNVIDTDYVVATIPLAVAPGSSITQGVTFDNGKTGRLVIGDDGNIIVRGLTAAPANTYLYCTVPYFLT